MALDHANDHGVTVRRLLAEELLRDTLLGGEAGLDQQVSWCVPASAETGDISDIQDHAGAAVHIAAPLLVERAATLIPQLHRREVSAILAWQTPEQHTDLTEAARHADEVGLPLLDLPTRVTFREASLLIGTKVLAQTTHVLEYGTRVHRALGDVFARGAGLPALTAMMARISGITVLVLNNAEDLLSQASPPNEAPLDSTHVTTVMDRLGAAGDLVDDDGDGLPRTLTLDIGGTPQQVVVTPIRVAGEPYGVLVLIGHQYPTPPHDLSQHYVMAEQGVSLVGSELLRQHSVREAEERARNDFVHALLHNRFADKLELTARAEYHRFPLDGRFAVYIVSAGSLNSNDTRSRRQAMDAVRRVRHPLTPDTAVTLAAHIGSMVVVVRQVPAAARPDSHSSEEARHLRAYGEQLHQTLLHRLGDDVRVTYGTPADGAAGVAQSYRDARTAAAIGKRVGATAVCAYQDLRVFAALQESALSRTGRAFAADILAPLQQDDGQTGNLEQVVLAYVEESGNLNATARRLHLHRNTMLYKLDRASRALQMDVRTSEVQFMIWLAHHITTLSEVVHQLDDELTLPPQP